MCEHSMKVYAEQSRHLAGAQPHIPTLPMRLQQARLVGKRNDVDFSNRASACYMTVLSIDIDRNAQCCRACTS